jgi:hypothetical protein
MLLCPPQSAVAASGNSRLTPIQVMGEWAELLLNVTSAAAAVGDTLDVYVQGSSDGGTTWDDIAHFTQVLGNGGAKKFAIRWQGDIAPTTALAAPQDGVLAAGVAQGPHGNLWSVKWVIVSSSAPLFSFAVTASGDIKCISRRGF